MEFTINGIPFLIDEFQDGWAWTNAETEGYGFDTAYEAQQDAMRWYQERAEQEADEERRAAEEAKYGTYEQQINDYYYSTRI